MLDDLLDADPVPVAEVIADTHYGSAELRQRLADDGVELVAPAPPASAPKGLFSKDDFTIDLDAATVTCPAGQTMPIPHRRPGKRTQVAFTTLRRLSAARPMHHPRQGSGDRDQPARRTPRPRPRRNAGHPSSDTATATAPEPNARSLRSSPAHTRSPGAACTKARAWAQLRAGALNLDRIGRLGLI